MKRFKNILVVCDEQSSFEQVADRVEWLATNNGARVTIIEIVDDDESDLTRLFSALPGLKGNEVAAQVVEMHQSNIKAHAETLAGKDIDVSTDVLVGRGFIEIIRQVLRGRHDLVIKSAQRSGGRTFFPGSDMHLMRKCPCPVWIVNAAAAPKSTRILAAVDPDPEEPLHDKLNQTIMQLATSLARQDGAKLDVINAWRLREESTLRHGLVKIAAEDVDKLVALEKEKSAKRLQELVAGYSEFDDLMRVLHIKGMASDIIPQHVTAEGIDTVVMGTLARTGVSGMFIGNTAETILGHVTCSVVTVKADGFVSPVTLEDN